MSDYLAVGGVSAVLCSLLATALGSGGPQTILGPTPGITALPPDLIETGQSEQAQVNLFLYYVTLNPALRNLGLPSASSQGSSLSNPPLALDLHYMVTAYGASQFAPEILLAWAMKVFHDTPVVPPLTIQTALTDLVQGQPSPSAEATLISGSTLAEQIEHIRITPVMLTTQEIYNLWTAFQAPYRPSAAMQVSVIVIQDTQPFTSALPVQSPPAVLALPMQPPVITSLSPVMITAGQVLTITGSGLSSTPPTDTVVSFDSGAPVPATVKGSQVQVTLPSTLQAGVRMVQVQRMVTFPTSAQPHQGFTSGPAPFQLVPVIQAPVPATAAGSSLTLTISPAVGSTQNVTVFIGGTAIPVDEPPPGGAASSTTVTVTVPASLAAGTYPVRVAVDGAQSLLTADATGQLTPQVQVTA
jgi:hypothetical protein